MNSRYVLRGVQYLFLCSSVFGMEESPVSSAAEAKRRLFVEKEDVVLPTEEPVDVEQKEEKATFLGSRDVIPPYMRRIYSDPGLHNYAAQSFVFSQPGVIDAMNKAVAERDAQVHLSVGVHSQNKPTAYKATSVVCDKEQHGKNIVGLSCSPSKDQPTHAVFLTGSGNPSNAIWPSGNVEAMVYVEGDIELSKKAYQLMKSESPVKKEKEVVQTTPQKREVYSSKKTSLNKSRAERILTVAHEQGDDRIAWASSMNINDKDMADALSEAAKNGVDTRLIVNKSALTKHGIPLLRSLADNGVKVFVFFPPEGSRRIYHKKELIRKDLYVISNANFTDEGDFQNNLETYFPNDLSLVAKAKEDFEHSEQQSVTFEKALELLEEQKAKHLKRKKSSHKEQKGETKKRKTKK